jgi:hypothetical protein
MGAGLSACARRSGSLGAGVAVDVKSFFMANCHTLPLALWVVGCAAAIIYATLWCGQFFCGGFVGSPMIRTIFMTSVGAVGSCDENGEAYGELRLKDTANC